MDGIEDYGGQHGQATAIAIAMARLGHRVCYLSRWPVARRSERAAALLEAGVAVLTPRWVGDRRLRLRPTPDDRARLRRLLRAAWQSRAIPSRSLLLADAVPERAAGDFARIAVDLLRRWRSTRAPELPLVLHVITRPSAQYLDGLRGFAAPIVVSEFGRLALYELDLETAPRLAVDAYTSDSPDSARELETVEQRPVSIIPCMAGFGEPTSEVPDLASRFVLANRLVGYKHTEVAVRAAACGGYELDIYGGGPEEPALRRLIEQLAAQQRLRLHGMAAAATIKTGLDASHAFISCSRLDGTPMAVLEAMSRGRAVVAYPIAGITTLIRDAVEGLYFDGSPSGLATTLGRLAHERGLAAELGRAARRRWEREFTPGALAIRYEEIYREVLSGAAGRASGRAV